MVWTPAAALVEDGTGKSGAVVFEQPSAGITWLNSRGKTAFSGSSSDAEQEQYGQEAVEVLSDMLRSMGFEAPPTVLTQALIWPARGAYYSDGQLIDTDELPVPFLEAVRLAQEHMAAGTWTMGDGDVPAGIVSESAEGVATTYRLGAATLTAQHPTIARRLRRCLR